MANTIRGAFTLIELLVVITIIVVLLALLTPALDKAVYEAQLAVCGTRLKGIGTGVTVYASNFRRNYPHRAGVEPPGTAWHPHKIWNGGGAAAPDDRKVLRGYLPINALLQDPLEERVDLEGAKSGSQTYAAYSLWFGYRYIGHLGMRRIGDRMEWADASETYRFDFLASDMDDIRIDNGNTFNSHPDDAGTLVGKAYQDISAADVGLGVPAGNWTLARWESTGNRRRGGTEMNYALADGSVRRLYRVLTNIDALNEDKRMVQLPTHEEATDTLKGWVQLPRQP